MKCMQLPQFRRHIEPTYFLDPAILGEIEAPPLTEKQILAGLSISPDYYLTAPEPDGIQEFYREIGEMVRLAKEAA